MGLKAAYNREIINPPKGIELGGYGFYRNRKNKGVHDDLWVRALLLESDDQTVLVYNADLLEVSEHIVREVRRRASKELGLRENNIIFTVTHTHSAPPTTRFRGLGEVDESYVNLLIDKFSKVIENITEKAVEVKPFFSQVKAEGIAFNRVVKGGPVDPMVRVVQLKKLSGGPFITLFNYSCHPVTIDVRTDAGFYVSADWPGVTMRLIEKRVGGVSTFLQGTCGDIDPVIAWSMKGFDASEEVGTKVAEAVVIATSKSEEVRGSELKVISDMISLPLQQMTHEDLIKIIALHLKRVEAIKSDITMDMSNILALIRFYRESMEELCEKISKGLPKSVDRDVHLIKIGDVAMLFIPGEVFVEIGLEVRNLSKLEKLLIAGYTGAYAGYIPTPEEFDRYGYAAYMVPLMLGWPPYEKDVAKVLVKKCMHLLSQVSSRIH